MKKLILAVTVALISLTANAQRKVVYDSKDGLVLAGTGIAFSLIAITCPDGSEWTNSRQGQHATIIRSPFYENPARDIVLGVGVTFTISGFIYHRNKK